MTTRFALQNNILSILMSFSKDRIALIQLNIRLIDFQEINMAFFKYPQVKSERTIKITLKDKILGYVTSCDLSSV
jgi:hypothetical protein